MQVTGTRTEGHLTPVDNSGCHFLARASSLALLDLVLQCDLARSSEFGYLFGRCYSSHGTHPPAASQTDLAAAASAPPPL